LLTFGQARAVFALFDSLRYIPFYGNCASPSVGARRANIGLFRRRAAQPGFQASKDAQYPRAPEGHDVLGLPAALRKAVVDTASWLNRNDLPLDRGGSPRQATAEPDNYDVVVGLEAAFLFGLTECNRDRRRRRVAVAMNIAVEQRLWHVQAAGRRTDDALVGLMRHDQRDVSHRQPGVCNDLTHTLVDDMGGETKHFAAIHMQFVECPAFRDAGIAHRRDAEQVCAGTVRAKHTRQQATWLVAALQDHRACAIAKQDTRRAIIPVQHPRVHFGADD